MTSQIHIASCMSAAAPGLDHIAADSLWSQLEDFSSSAGFSHWGYSAEPTCPQTAAVLRASTYPLGHIEGCARLGLCPSTLVRHYVVRHTRPASFSTVREGAPKSREFLELLDINRQFRVTRGICIPLTSYLGATGMLALTFDGTDTQLQRVWRERGSDILQQTRLFHGELLRRHLHRLAVNAVPRLPSRQRELLQQLALGFTTAQIAKFMDISIHTVNKHITAIKRRFGARSAAHAAVLAVQWGLL